MVSRRRQELRELVERFRRLPTEERRPTGRVFGAYVAVQVVLELVVLVVGARTVRRFVRGRRSGARSDLAAAWRSPLVVLLVLYRVERLVARFLLVRHLRRTVPRS